MALSESWLLSLEVLLDMLISLRVKISMNDSLITLFIPGNVIESTLNTFPGATLEDKLKIAMRRFLSCQNFITGEIKESTPQVFINKVYFSQIDVGYNVIAKIL